MTTELAIYNSIERIIEYWETNKFIGFSSNQNDDSDLRDECLKIARRLIENSPVKNIEAIEASPPPSSDEEWFVIEDLPLPQGGFDGLSNYINKQVAANKSDEVEGANVFVFFVITEKGEISSVKVLKSSGIEKVDKLAVNIIEGMPNWKPGFQLNKNVPVEYTINVEF